jgi:hypothetical protein
MRFLQGQNRLCANALAQGLAMFFQAGVPVTTNTFCPATAGQKLLLPKRFTLLRLMPEHRQPAGAVPYPY